MLLLRYMYFRMTSNKKNENSKLFFLSIEAFIGMSHVWLTLNAIHTVSSDREENDLKSERLCLCMTSASCQNP